MAIKVFRRVEQKYLINKSEYKEILNKTKDKLEKDFYFESNICNIYFDTLDDYLIKRSIDKPIYKEKVRLRSYKIPNKNDNVFLEVKKKYKGEVNKRRVILTLEDFYDFYNNKKIVKNNQIMKEISYVFDKYKLYPKIFIGYNRYSYKGIDDNEFRVTFDYNIRTRTDNLKLELGDNGKKVLDEDKYIMEVKCLDSIPIWFKDILTQLKIYPVSFSKYGYIYKKGMN